MKILSPAKKGLLTGIIMAATAWGFYSILHKTLEGPYQYAIYAIYTMGIIWSVWEFSKMAPKETKFKEYFLIGFKTFVVVTLVMVVFVFIFFSTYPEIRDLKIEANNKLLVQEGNHTLDEITNNAEKMKSMFLPIIISATIFMYLFLGAIITAVTAGVIMQKKNY